LKKLNRYTFGGIGSGDWHHMFGLFRNKQNKNLNIWGVFDLEPLYLTLNTGQRIHFEQLANRIHMDVHRTAYLRGYEFFLECWIAVERASISEPTILTPNIIMVIKSFSNDREAHGGYNFAEMKYSVLFPVLGLQSVAALSRSGILNINQSNDILSVISGECAIEIIKKKFVPFQSDI
jgi:hypothetical protein